jgi:hypothetical protein
MTIPRRAVDSVQEGIPRDDFTFIVNHKTFPSSGVEAVGTIASSSGATSSRRLCRKYVICDPEIDSPDFSALQNLFSGIENVVKSCIRTHSFCSADNFAMSGLSDFSLISGATQPSTPL